MKIIHCADLHLDSKMNANLSGEKAKERKAELLVTFNRMIEYAVENHVKAILIAGDLFDTKRISASAKNTVYGAIEKNPDIVFYYLKGNHDEDSIFDSYEEIPGNLKMFGDKWTSYPDDENNAIVITGVEINKDNQIEIYNNMALDADKFNIVMLHGQEGDDVSIKDLKNKGIDYLALGHIHSYKKEKLDARGIYCYPGCLEGRGFDECGEHGFVEMEINESDGSFSLEFVPFAKRRLYTIYIDVTGAMTTMDIAERINLEICKENPGEENLIKLVLTGEVDVQCEKNIELLVKQFENQFYFLKIYDEMSYKVDYNDFLLDKSLKGEFVRTVMSAENIDDEKKANIISIGIKALAGEAIE